ncbi:MAG TPA: hypothetical protein VHE55_08215 [Fimbriimonadaceae bacterium]|nr:hypothetical protein [Fimbriimonadaceae bacterium]
MRIFLSAGEASGDAYAAALVEALRKTNTELGFEGIGGKRLAGAIGSLVADSSKWGAISIVQSLRVLPRAFRGWILGKRRLATGTPGLFVAIDFGFFNIRLCRYAKRRGWKVLYFMPPSSWRRDRQGRDLPDVADLVVTPFPWSAEILKGIGVDAYFFGHPLKQLIREAGAARTGGSTVAMLPGSRTHELDRNLPMFAEVARSLTERFEFAISPNLDLGEVRALWNRLAPGRDDLFTQGDVYGVLGRARAALVCSGTATLEAALMRCAHVVVYRVTKAMAREAKLIGFKMPKFISLPNIVLDRESVPELVGLDISTADILACLQPLLADSPEREAQLRDFDEIDRVLGGDDAITETARLLVETLRSQ